MAPNPRGTRHLGLDLGATNLKWAVLGRDDAGWSRLGNGQAPTRSAADDVLPDLIVGQLAETAGAAAAEWGPLASTGIGVPGLYDAAGGTIRKLVNVRGDWAGRPVAAPVAAAGGCPASLTNDARAFGLAELLLGAGRGASTMIGITLGTGVGGVLAFDGHVHQGHDGTAGEVGHQTIDPDGPWCGCGNRGCLEAFTRADQIAAACGTASAEEAVQRARAGDPRAVDGLAQVGRYLGIGIGNLVTVFTPDRVVIGGGVAPAAGLLLDAVWSELHRRVHVTSLDALTIVAAELGTWAGAIGAALHGAQASSSTTTGMPLQAE